MAQKKTAKNRPIPTEIRIHFMASDPLANERYFMSGLALIFSNLLILLSVLTLLWALSVRIKDASIVDIFWGPACALPAILTYLRMDGAAPRDFLLTGLVSVWAARLALYLGRRNLGHGEDYRYVKMRQRQGSDKAMARWSLYRVFWLQGLIAWTVSIPVQLGQFGPEGLSFIAYIGAALFVIGLLFETIGDAQLTAFKAKPENKGKLMTQGVWAITRHPNYFGDAAVWSGLAIIALESPLGGWAFISPIVMTFFLYAVSGKALTEKHMRAKYPEYSEYVGRVSGFIPWFPRKAS